MRPLLSLTASLGLFSIASLTLAQGAVDPSLAKAKQVYDVYCQACHGPNGDGKGPVGVALQPPPRDFTKADFLYGGTNEAIFEVITNGAATKGGSPLMAPWGAVIPEADRQALVRFIRSLKK
jgi:mono/diheme cytochrome c family protein